MAKDYYQTLGVDKTANAQEIKKAFRKKAHQHHPDKGGDEAAFKEINEAYQVLSDQNKRQQYDQYGQTFDGQGGFGGFQGGFQNVNFSDFADAFGGFGDIFSGFSGQRSRTARGTDILVDVELTLKDVAHGTDRTISLHKTDRCDACKGSGAKQGTSTKTCGTCNGQGQVQAVQQTILGAMRSLRACTDCQATGSIPEEKCSSCDGQGSYKQTKDFNIKIPAGIDNGEQIRVSGEGEWGPRGSQPGDLYVRVHVKPHDKIVRQGIDVKSVLKVPFTIATIGGEVETETIDGNTKVKIPAGTQSGQVIRLKDHGITQLHGSHRGDHYLEVHIQVPKKLSRKAKKLISELEKEL